MYWNNFSDFLAMGNHGIYVWGSAIVMAMTMALEPFLLMRSRKVLIARLRRQFCIEKSTHADYTTSSQG